MKYQAENKIITTEAINIIDSFFDGDIEKFETEIYKELAIKIIKDMSFEDFKKIFKLEFEDEYDGFVRWYRHRITI